jgi:hypothetical protein
MEIGAFFILVIVAGVLAVGGLLLYGVAGKLRHDKLHPAEDKLDGGSDPADAHPQHVRVSNEQRSRFLPSR